MLDGARVRARWGARGLCSMHRLPSPYSSHPLAVGRSHASCAVLTLLEQRPGPSPLQLSCVPHGPEKASCVSSLSVSLSLSALPEEIRTCSAPVLFYYSSGVTPSLSYTWLSNFINGGRSMNRGWLPSIDRGHRENIYRGTTSFSLPFFFFSFLSVAVRFLRA